MAAITRVEGPMLLANLDRQGTELSFTTTGSSLLYLDFSKFQVGINTTLTSEDLTVNGNVAITTVKIDKFSTISTTQLNQHLTLTANGTGNVIIVNANVISGNIDNTQIGTVTPAVGTFTRANVVTKAELKLANVQNLTGNRIVYTAADNTQLEDDEGLQWFSSNNTLIAQNFATTQSSLFPSLTSDNVQIPTIANNSVVYIAANNQLIGTPTLTYFAGNGMLRVTGNITMTGQTQNRVIYKNTNDQLVTSDRLTYDGTNFSSPFPNTNIFGNLRITGDTLEQVAGATLRDIRILPSDLVFGQIYFGGATRLYGAKTVTAAEATSDTVATVGYVTNSMNNAVFSSIEIAQGDSFVRVVDPASGVAVPNVFITVDNVKNSEFTNGFANIQNLSIHDAVISAQYGELYLEPYNNSRLRILSNTSVSIPSGTTAQRPATPVRGDLRHNTDFNQLEFSDGVGWNSVATTAYSQVLTPDGVSSAFTLQRPATSETILLVINGVVQRPTYSYTVVGTTLTMNEVPLVTDIMEVRYLTYGITYASTPLFVNNPYTPFGTSFTTIDSWYLSQYRGVEYSFVFKNDANSQYAMGTVYMMHDGIDTYLNVKEYSNGSTPYLTFNSYIDVYGVCTLQVRGLNTGNNIKFRATYFNDDMQAIVSWSSSGLIATIADAQRTSISVQLTANTSGAGVVTYALYTGTLPPGCSISATGLISGGTTGVLTSTTYSFTVAASAPGASTVVSSLLSITILPP